LSFICSYVIKGDVCTLCLCEKNFPRKSAFAYLEDVTNEFNSQHGGRIDQVTRPYHFIEFGSSFWVFFGRNFDSSYLSRIVTSEMLTNFLGQAKRKYADKSRHAMSAVSNELQDVARIMVSNIEDVIHRGEALNILETRASDLSDISRKYREDAKQLNKRSTLFKAAVTVCVIALLGFIARYVFW
uniref:Uncharacterized protein n=1 Tax=Parascaris equorum TaxID=6256 RepID=A0A914RHD5_PAREQ